MSAVSYRTDILVVAIPARRSIRLCGGIGGVRVCKACIYNIRIYNVRICNITRVARMGRPRIELAVDTVSSVFEAPARTRIIPIERRFGLRNRATV